MAQFFAYTLLSISKKVYLQILKKPDATFCLYPSLNIRKSIIANLKKNLTQFLAYTLFQISKKVYLQILKIPGAIFCLYPFLNIKKSILTNLKKNLTQCFAYTLFQMLQILKIPFFIQTVFIKTIIIIACMS